MSALDQLLLDLDRAIVRGRLAQARLERALRESRRGRP